MDAALEAQRLALGAMQQACAQQPGVHAHQLRALDRDLALCGAAATLCDYQRAAGGGFELARAAWLDRVAGRFQVARALGDRHAARSALAEYRGALAAQQLSDWTEALTAAALAARPWRERSAQAGSSLTRTVLNALLHHSCTPPMADHWGDAVDAWHSLCTADPAAARALRQGAIWPARMVPRLPWREGPARVWLQRMLSALPAAPAAKPAGDPAEEPGGEEGESADTAMDAELSDMQAGWLHALRGTAAQSEVVMPAGEAIWTATAASADQALAPWRQLADAAPTAGPAMQAMARVARQLLVRAAGAGSGPDVLRCAIESGLLTALATAPLLGRLNQIEKRQVHWPQPLLAAHARTLRAALQQAGTATEVELLWVHADACLDVEADWQSLFYATQLAPLRATLNFAISPTEAGRGLRGASAICRGLLGQAPAATLQGRLVQAVVEAHLAKDTSNPGDAAVAWRGEEGQGLLPLLQAWCAVAASRGATVPEDRTGLQQALQHLASQCLETQAAGEPVWVQLWSARSIAPQASQLLTSPRRPAVPLWQDKGRVADAM